MSPYGPRVSIASVLAAEAYAGSRGPAPRAVEPVAAVTATAPAATATAVVDGPTAAGSRRRFLELLRPVRRAA
ncbi:hypothetical protein [Kineococcus auxinigenes]|uniref:hypothetical protein n=1 Tax=unclassified Kineococcus TaxID=2621656 RepID=UPI003D7E47D7